MAMEWRIKALLGTAILLFTFIALSPGDLSVKSLPKIVHHTHDDISGVVLGDIHLSAFAESFRSLYKPILLPVTAPTFRTNDTTYELSKTHWTTSLGKDLCITDVDTRPFDQEGQLLSGNFSWSLTDGLSAGMVNHFLYASVHGYTYYLIQPESYPDQSRADVWRRTAKLKELLDVCRIVLAIDNDLVIQHFEVPFEWLLNRWDIGPDTALALPWEPAPQYKESEWKELFESLGLHDPHGMLDMNAGMIVAQDLPRTREILDAWYACPDDHERFPGCDRFAVAFPAEQEAFNEYIRHMYNETNDLQPIPCTEANGFPSQNTECAGTFLRHFTSDKTLVKQNAGDVLLESISHVIAAQYR